MFAKKIHHIASELSHATKELLFLLKQNKYSFVRAIMLSLVVVFLYNLFSTPNYKISTTVFLKETTQVVHTSPVVAQQMLTPVHTASARQEEVPPIDLDLLKSENALQKAVTALDLNIRYFTAGTLRKKEIYGQDVPIRLTLLNTKKPLQEHTLRVKLVDSKTFVLREGEIVTAYVFGQVIEKPYASFIVTPGHTFGVQNKEIVIKLKDAEVVAEQYEKKLSFRTSSVDSRLITIHLAEEIPQRGVDLLHKMAAIYATGEDKASSSDQLTQNFIKSNLDSIEVEIKRLDRLAEQYQEQLRVEEVNSRQVSRPQPKLLHINARQKNALKAIQPYVSKPVTQFTLIPTNFDLGDQELTALIQDFNQEQQEKQLLLRDYTETDPRVAQSSQLLLHLQTAIANKIAAIQKGIAAKENQNTMPERQVKPLEPVVASVADLLENIEEERQAKKTQYIYFLQQSNTAAAAPVTKTVQLSVLDKPEDNIEPIQNYNRYLYALLIGFCLPIFFIRVLHW